MGQDRNICTDASTTSAFGRHPHVTQITPLRGSLRPTGRNTTKSNVNSRVLVIGVRFTTRITFSTHGQISRRTTSNVVSNMSLDFMLDTRTYLSSLPN